MPAEDDYRPGNPDHAGGPLLVALTGCSGSGKSTLLARRGHEVAPEAGRQIVREQMQIGGPALPWRDAGAFVDLAVSRAMAQFNAVRPVGDLRPHGGRSRLLPCPPGTGDPRSSAPGARHLPLCAAGSRHAAPWEAIYADDGERRKSFAEALAEHQTTIAAYRSQGYRLVEVPRASCPARRLCRGGAGRALSRVRSARRAACLRRSAGSRRRWPWATARPSPHSARRG